MSAIAAAMLVTAAVGVSEGGKARKAAGKAQASSDAIAAEQLALSKEELAYKKDLVGDMLGSADLSEADYASEIGEATAGVRSSFSKAAEIEGRRLGRYGINPESGRGRSLAKRDALGMAVSESGAANRARRSLKTYERGATERARMAGLGLTDPSIGVLGEQSRTQAARASDYSRDATSAYGSAAETVGLFAGYGGRKLTPKPEIPPPSSRLPSPQPILRGA